MAMKKNSFNNFQKKTYKVFVCAQESTWKQKRNKHKMNLKIVFHSHA